jgi:hypothetical protein
MDNHRQGPGIAPPGESSQATDVVEVAVAEHHGVHAGQVQAEPAGVGDHRIGGSPVSNGCYSWLAGSTISMSPVLTS